MKKFQDTFTEGARLYRVMTSISPTDDQIDELCTASSSWADGAFGWLKKDVSSYAAERFAFRPVQWLHWTVSGTHKADYVEKYSGCVMALNGWLINIDTLMRDPSIYPEK